MTPAASTSKTTSNKGHPVTSYQNMPKTMEQMLANEGYAVHIGITPGGYVATTTVNGPAEMTLTYPLTLNPGDVVFEVRGLLNKLNGK